ASDLRDHIKAFDIFEDYSTNNKLSPQDKVKKYAEEFNDKNGIPVSDEVRKKIMARPDVQFVMNQKIKQESSALEYTKMADSGESLSGIDEAYTKHISSYMPSNLVEYIESLLSRYRLNQNEAGMDLLNKEVKAYLANDQWDDAFANEVYGYVKLFSRDSNLSRRDIKAKLSASLRLVQGKYKNEFDARPAIAQAQAKLANRSITQDQINSAFSEGTVLDGINGNIKSAPVKPSVELSTDKPAKRKGSKPPISSIAPEVRREGPALKRQAPAEKREVTTRRAALITEALEVRQLMTSLAAAVDVEDIGAPHQDQSDSIVAFIKPNVVQSIIDDASNNVTADDVLRFSIRNADGSINRPVGSRPLSSLQTQERRVSIPLNLTDELNTLDEPNKRDLFITVEIVDQFSGVLKAGPVTVKSEINVTTTNATLPGVEIFGDIYTEVRHDTSDQFHILINTETTPEILEDILAHINTEAPSVDLNAVADDFFFRFYVTVDGGTDTIGNDEVVSLTRLIQLQESGVDSAFVGLQDLPLGFSALDVYVQLVGTGLKGTGTRFQIADNIIVNTRDASIQPLPDATATYRIAQSPEGSSRVIFTVNVEDISLFVENADNLPLTADNPLVRFVVTEYDDGTVVTQPNIEIGTLAVTVIDTRSDGVLPVKITDTGAAIRANQNNSPHNIFTSFPEQVGLERASATYDNAISMQALLLESYGSEGLERRDAALETFRRLWFETHRDPVTNNPLGFSNFYDSLGTGSDLQGPGVVESFRTLGPHTWIALSALQAGQTDFAMDIVRYIATFGRNAEGGVAKGPSSDPTFANTFVVEENGGLYGLLQKLSREVTGADLELVNTLKDGVESFLQDRFDSNRGLFLRSNSIGVDAFDDTLALDSQTFPALAWETGAFEVFLNSQGVELVEFVQNIESEFGVFENGAWVGVDFSNQFNRDQINSIPNERRDPLIWYEGTEQTIILLQQFVDFLQERGTTDDLDAVDTLNEKINTLKTSVDAAVVDGALPYTNSINGGELVFWDAPNFRVASGPSAASTAWHRFRIASQTLGFNPLDPEFITPATTITIGYDLDQLGDDFDIGTYTIGTHIVNAGLKPSDPTTIDEVVVNITASEIFERAVLDFQEELQTNADILEPDRLAIGALMLGFTAENAPNGEGIDFLGSTLSDAEITRLRDEFSSLFFDVDGARDSEDIVHNLEDIVQVQRGFVVSDGAVAINAIAVSLYNINFLRDAGLTFDEVARIQPAGDGVPEGSTAGAPILYIDSIDAQTTVSAFEFAAEILDTYDAFIVEDQISVDTISIIVNPALNFSDGYDDIDELGIAFGLQFTEQGNIVTPEQVLESMTSYIDFQSAVRAENDEFSTFIEDVYAIDFDAEPNAESVAIYGDPDIGLGFREDGSIRPIDRFIRFIQSYIDTRTFIVNQGVESVGILTNVFGLNFNNAPTIEDLRTFDDPTTGINSPPAEFAEFIQAYVDMQTSVRGQSVEFRNLITNAYGLNFNLPATNLSLRIFAEPTIGLGFNEDGSVRSPAEFVIFIQAYIDTQTLIRAQGTTSIDVVTGAFGINFGNNATLPGLRVFANPATGIRSGPTGEPVTPEQFAEVIQAYANMQTVVRSATPEIQQQFNEAFGVDFTERATSGSLDIFVDAERGLGFEGRNMPRDPVQLSNFIQAYLDMQTAVTSKPSDVQEAVRNAFGINFNDPISTASLNIFADGIIGLGYEGENLPRDPAQFTAFVQAYLNMQNTVNVQSELVRGTVDAVFGINFSETISIASLNIFADPAIGLGYVDADFTRDPLVFVQAVQASVDIYVEFLRRTSEERSTFTQTSIAINSEFDLSNGINSPEELVAITGLIFGVDGNATDPVVFVDAMIGLGELHTILDTNQRAIIEQLYNIDIADQALDKADYLRTLFGIVGDPNYFQGEFLIGLAKAGAFLSTLSADANFRSDFNTTYNTNIDPAAELSTEDRIIIFNITSDPQYVEDQFIEDLGEAILLNTAFQRDFNALVDYFNLFGRSILRVGPRALFNIVGDPDYNQADFLRVLTNASDLFFTLSIGNNFIIRNDFNATFTTNISPTTELSPEDREAIFNVTGDPQYEEDQFIEDLGEAVLLNGVFQTDSEAIEDYINLFGSGVEIFGARALFDTVGDPIYVQDEFLEDLTEASDLVDIIRRTVVVRTGFNSTFDTNIQTTGDLSVNDRTVTFNIVGDDQFNEDQFIEDLGEAVLLNGVFQTDTEAIEDYINLFGSGVEIFGARALFDTVGNPIYVQADFLEDLTESGDLFDSLSINNIVRINFNTTYGTNISPAFELSAEDRAVLFNVTGDPQYNQEKFIRALNAAVRLDRVLQNDAEALEDYINLYGDSIRTLGPVTLFSTVGDPNYNQEDFLRVLTKASDLYDALKDDPALQDMFNKTYDTNIDSISELSPEDRTTLFNITGGPQYVQDDVVGNLLVYTQILSTYESLSEEDKSFADEALSGVANFELNTEINLRDGLTEEETNVIRELGLTADGLLVYARVNEFYTQGGVAFDQINGGIPTFLTVVQRIFDINGEFGTELEPGARSRAILADDTGIAINQQNFENKEYVRVLFNAAVFVPATVTGYAPQFDDFSLAEQASLLLGSVKHFLPLSSGKTNAGEAGTPGIAGGRTFRLGEYLGVGYVALGVNDSNGNPFGILIGDYINGQFHRYLENSGSEIDYRPLG
ncbi:MAG: hypothetical protein ACI9CF_001816, partial [Candidatus Omnitrophota bacterium]